ncbi:MAG: ATP-binding cassette domain-containing protein, partial [Verrucomicrobia bacterium]|nr:ATP-binding cassette domain-containing protein [Verrucomicrobiota bacterium]
EDRKEQGLLLPLPVRVNLTLAHLRPLCRLGGWINPVAEHRAAEQWTQRLAVRCATVEQPVAELSGGNQQKVVVAKWLHRDCRILLFDEPTRGIDIAAKFELYRWLDQLAAQGKALIVVSSDLEELMLISDRIAVLSRGRIAAEFGRQEWSREKIMTAAVSGGQPRSTATAVTRA